MKLVIVIDSNDTIAQMNSKIVMDATKQHDGITGLVKYLESIQGGCFDGSIQAITRDTDPVVATSGAGSLSVTWNLK